MGHVAGGQGDWTALTHSKVSEHTLDLPRLGCRIGVPEEKEWLRRKSKNKKK